MKINYFNFKKFGEKVLLTNDLGEYTFIKKDEFSILLNNKIEKDSSLEKKLKKAHIIYDDSELEFSEVRKHDIRETKNHLFLSSSLHIFVVTTACNMNCIYCQANNGMKNSNLYMDEVTAEKAVNIALQSPTKYLTFEFQGGEPFLNFSVIKYIVEYTEKNKGNHVVNYSIVSNLTLLDEEKIFFMKKYNFGVSTSIDGHKNLHNFNRRYKDGTPTFVSVVEAVKRLQESGICVGAIETTTKESLKYPKEIVNTYYDLGFDGIFIRPLTPLGKASMNWSEIGYSAEEFLDFYKEALNAVLELNQNGRFFKEDYAAILLKKIFGQFVNYMELRSPCGAGIGQLAYYANGKIFTCDEGRMLYEMGNDAFCLGNVIDENYQKLINNSVCKTVCAASILETIPSCCDCVYQPYCGTCPVVNYALTGDILEKTPRNYRCKIYSGIMDILFSILLKEEKEKILIFQSWSN